MFGCGGASWMVWYHRAPSSHTPSARSPPTRSSSHTFIMPAPTASTTFHSHNITACVVATPIRTWVRTILTEVGSELLGRGQADRGVLGRWVSRISFSSFFFFFFFFDIHFSAPRVQNPM